MPATKSRPALLAVEVNPVKDGKPSKRKGLFLTSFGMFGGFLEVMSNDYLPTLLKTMDAINDAARPKGVERKPLDLDA